MRYTRILEEPTNQSVTLKNETQHLMDQQTFVQLLAKHKALLLRSDEEDEPYTVDDFAEIIQNLNLEEYEYVGGAAPRRIIPTDQRFNKVTVYTANEAPPEMAIPFHHELAQVKCPPVYIFFYCDLPSETGGETALIDSTLVYRFLHEYDPDFMNQLKLHGARYTRTLPPQDDTTSPIGRSYFNTYNVTTKEELEQKLHQIQGLEYQWLEDGCIRITSEPIPAIRIVEQHHDQPIYQWTFHNSIVAAFIGWQDSRNNRRESIRFGNDEPMSEKVLEAIANFMDQNKVSYPWKKGDIFAIHNQLVMHSRNPFTGPRKVYAAMAGDVRVDATLASEPIYKNSTVSNPETFGLWRLATPEESVYNAIQVGYRRIDSACDYGNEEFVGRGIQRAIQEGICTREELYITTKLWNTYHDPKHVPLALEKSLRDLNLDYVDEYLIHFPISLEYVPIEEKYPPEWTNTDGKMVIVPNDINKTWQAMEALVDDGKTRHIGLSNFNCQHIRQVLSIARIQPTTLQIECHPHLSQNKLIRFAREVAKMRVSVFSPLGATSYLSLHMATEKDVLLFHPTVRDVASKHNKTPAQILLRWSIQRNTLPISKSDNIERMKENRSLYDFYLFKEDVDAINALNVNQRYNDPGVFCEAVFGTFCPIYE